MTARRLVGGWLSRLCLGDRRRHGRGRAIDDRVHHRGGSGEGAA